LEHLKLVYGNYIRYLLFSVIAIGLVLTILGNRAISGNGILVYLLSIDLFNTIVGLVVGDMMILSIFILTPILAISWSGGLLYLNHELWCTRHYLDYLDQKLEEIEGYEILRFHADIIGKEIYSNRIKLLFNQPLNLILNYFVVALPGSIFLIAVFLSTAAIYKVSGSVLYSSIYAAFFIGVISLIVGLKLYMSAKVKDTLFDKNGKAK